MGNRSIRWERMDSVTGTLGMGRLFLGPELLDLSGIKILSAGVDTLRQLYYGKLKPEPVAEIQAMIEGGAQLATFFGLSWHVGKSPMGSGYKYKLQNNDYGLIILLKSIYATDDKQGTHLKVEASPHLIRAHSPKDMQDIFDGVSVHFLDSPEYAGIAIHLAVDVQGWCPSSSFLERFTTRARYIQGYKGIDKLETDLSETALVYGDNETFTFGRASSLQFTTYRKDKEILRRDKVDQWHDYWQAMSGGSFDKSQHVQRLEARFHHSVVAEVGNGIGETLTCYLQASEYLTDLWRYALKNNRLDYSSQYIAPEWQLLTDDVEFICHATGVHIRREKKVDLHGIGRNFAQIIGNMITVAARNAWKVSDFIRQVKKLYFYEELMEFYSFRGWGESEFREMVEKEIALRRLIGKVA